MGATANDLIDRIANIRVNNNKLWMDVLKLAFKHAPIKAAHLIKEITDNDKKVSSLSSQLGDISD